jgi:hypothetical protein
VGGGRVEMRQLGIAHRAPPVGDFLAFPSHDFSEFIHRGKEYENIN